MPIIHRENGIPPSKSRLIDMGGVYSDSMNQYTTESKTFTPPAGKNWKIVTALFDVAKPTGGSSGYHEFSVLTGSRNIMRGQSAFGTDLQWDFNTWIIADNLKHPDGAAAISALHGAIFDHDHPVIVTYKNYVNATQSHGRSIYLHVEETPII